MTTTDIRKQAEANGHSLTTNFKARKDHRGQVMYKACWCDKCGKAFFLQVNTALDSQADYSDNKCPQA